MTRAIFGRRRRLHRGFHLYRSDYYLHSAARGEKFRGAEERNRGYNAWKILYGGRLLFFLPREILTLPLLLPTFFPSLSLSLSLFF